MFSKSEVMRLFLCDARRRKRSIVELCEHFGVRRTRAKRTHQNDFSILGGCVDGFDYLVRVSAASLD